MYNHSSQCNVFFLAAENAAAAFSSYSPSEETKIGLIPFYLRLDKCLQYLYMAIFSVTLASYSTICS